MKLSEWVGNLIKFISHELNVTNNHMSQTFIDTNESRKPFVSSLHLMSNLLFLQSSYRGMKWKVSQFSSLSTEIILWIKNVASVARSKATLKFHHIEMFDFEVKQDIFKVNLPGMYFYLTGSKYELKTFVT